MRRTISAVVILIGGLFAAVGCKENDKLSIVGVYSLSHEKTTSCFDPADNQDQAKTCTATDCETLTIGGGGTFSLVEIKGGVNTTINGSYIMNGNQITFSYSIGGVSETDVATFALSKTQLVLSFEQDTDGCLEVDTFTRK